MWWFTLCDMSHYLTIMLCDANIMWHYVWCNHVMELSCYVTITLCNLTLCSCTFTKHSHSYPPPPTIDEIYTYVLCTYNDIAKLLDKNYGPNWDHFFDQTTPEEFGHLRGPDPSVTRPCFFLGLISELGTRFFWVFALALSRSRRSPFALFFWP